MMSTFEASQTAYFWHKNQRYGDHPYLTHLAEVAAMVDRMNAGVVAINVAYLHDILEDTAIPLSELQDKFSDEVVKAVQALTKVDGELYSDYIKKVRRNPIARRVKIADTLCNLTHSVVESNKRRIHRYTTQLQLLTNALGDDTP